MHYRGKQVFIFLLLKYSIKLKHLNSFFKPSNPVGCRISSPLQLTKVCMFLQPVIFKLNFRPKPILNFVLVKIFWWSCFFFNVKSIIVNSNNVNSCKPEVLNQAFFWTMLHRYCSSISHLPQRVFVYCWARLAQWRNPYHFLLQGYSDRDIWSHLNAHVPHHK